MDLQIIIPRAPSAYQLKINWHYELWKQEKEAKEQQFVIENVRFQHDPLWASKFISIQSAHDGNNIIWKMARPLMTLAASVAMPTMIGPVAIGSVAFTIGLWVYIEMAGRWRNSKI